MSASLYDIAQVEYPMTPAGACLRNNILATLNKYYPDMFPGWIVVVMQEQDCIVIKNARLSGKMGMRMFISKIDPELRCVIRHAGELLERYRVARTKHLAPEATAELAVDYRGEVEFDT
jgi:hypothetical protein